MGKDPAEIERQIAQKRAALSARMDDVRHRVRSDVRDLQQSARDEATATVNETKRTLNINAQAKEHPLSMLTGALGLGVILGAASEGMPGGGRNGKPENSRDYGGRSSSSSNDNGNGLLGGLMMSVAGPATETIRDEIQSLVKEGFATFKSSTGLEKDASDQETGSPQARLM
jgi:hypothetical protein